MLVVANTVPLNFVELPDNCQLHLNQNQSDRGDILHILKVLGIVLNVLKEP